MILEGKTAIITGSGKGIGRVIALTFVKEGCNVILVSRTLLDLKKVADEIKTLNKNIKTLTLKADVSNCKEVKSFIGKAMRKFNAVDILVNNAGILGPIGPFVDNDIKLWEEVLRINLMGIVYCTKSILPFMIKQGRGKIINLSGGGATSPFPRFSAYGTSKAAVVRLTETLSCELAPYNIQVNAVAPGAVNTQFLGQVLAAGEKAGEHLEIAKVQKKDGGIPPEAAAKLALFLASDKSNGLTGRLISAVWDKWTGFDKVSIKDIMNSSAYTLRRIDIRNFKETNKVKLK